MMRDMRTCGEISSRERVLLALNHQETDRVPIAMVCSGINEPARGMFAEHLRCVPKEKGFVRDDRIEMTSKGQMGSRQKAILRVRS